MCAVSFSYLKQFQCCQSDLCFFRHSTSHFELKSVPSCSTILRRKNQKKILGSGASSSPDFSVGKGTPSSNSAPSAPTSPRPFCLWCSGPHFQIASDAPDNAVSCNGTNYCNPHCDPYQHQNLVSCRQSHIPVLKKSSKFVHNVVILGTERQTGRKTDKQTNEDKNIPALAAVNTCNPVTITNR